MSASRSLALSRRRFLALAGSSCLGAAALRLPQRHALPPVRAITRGPKHHWFGYYDKLQFDPSCRRVLGMQVGFEHRSPKADDEIAIGYVDLDADDAWHQLGTSRSWGWQQGCMLQWRPGSSTEVLWNDRRDDAFVCRVHDVETGEERVLPRPIYTLSPDGRTAVGVDFRRINEMRRGYGYAGLADPHRDEPMPLESGIDRIDLETGAHEQIVSIRDIAAVVDPEQKNKHYFNHLLFNTDGTRLVFLHRWRPRSGGGFKTRMLTASPDGGEVRVLDPSGTTSHFVWRDPKHVLAWSRPAGRAAGFYLFEDGGDSAAVEPVGEGVMKRNGHCTYLPGAEWILNDTYPGRERLQHPYLFRVASGEMVPLGHFRSPPKYAGEWRCDTHPRFSPDGKSVVIDSPHGGDGRQMWLIDIAEILG